MTMTDIPSRDALIEAGARALCDASDADWDYVLSIEGHPLAKACRQGAAGVLDAILPLVLAGAGEALGDLDGAFIEYQADDNCPCSGWMR